MFGLCKHKWVETQRKTFPSMGRPTKIWGEMTYDQRKMIFGYTTIEYQCEHCGKHRREDFIGEL